MSPTRRLRIGVKVPGLWAMMYVLFAPAQLQRQAPQRGTAARPMQSRYHPTGWTSPSLGMTMEFARTARGAGGALIAGAACPAGLTAAAAAGGAAVVAAASTRAASSAVRASRASWRTRRGSAAPPSPAALGAAGTG